MSKNVLIRVMILSVLNRQHASITIMPQPSARSRVWLSLSHLSFPLQSLLLTIRLLPKRLFSLTISRLLISAKQLQRHLHISRRHPRSRPYRLWHVLGEVVKQHRVLDLDRTGPGLGPESSPVPASIALDFFSLGADIDPDFGNVCLRLRIQSALHEPDGIRGRDPLRWAVDVVSHE